MRIKNLYKFFDYLGVVVFPYLAIDSIVYVAHGIADPRVIIRLIIGVGGTMIDGYLVFIYKK